MPDKKDIRRQKDEIKNLIRNSSSENHIPGIHNYCDRWCEKCEFTDRCATYSFEESSKEVFSDPDAKWDHLSIILNATFEYLSEELKKHGYTEEQMAAMADEASPEEEVKPEDNELHTFALDYGTKVHQWIKDNDSLISSLPFLTKKINGIKVSEYIAIITWYHLFICAKSDRALGGLNDKSEFSVSDSNGSAKIALIAVERSIASWGALLNVLESDEDSIYTFLKMLFTIKKQLNALFPHAEEFVRPGFDEKL